MHYRGTVLASVLSEGLSIWLHSLRLPTRLRYKTDSKQFSSQGTHMLLPYMPWMHRNTQLFRCTITKRFCGLHSRCLSFYLVPDKHRSAYVDLSLHRHTAAWGCTSLHEGTGMFSEVPSHTIPITAWMQNRSLDVKAISKQLPNVEVLLMPRCTCS